MKTWRWMIGLVAAGCALGTALPPRAAAEISDDDFKALKEEVRKLNEKVDKLEQTHATDEQTHQKDTQELQQLRQKLDESQQKNSQAEQKGAAVASQVQPLPRVPIDEATVNHNFMILGDAEFQWAKSGANNSTFWLADFAPIFLYRGGDNILFESGFDFVLQNNAPGSPGYTTTINLSFAQLNYVMNDYMTFPAGNMLLPLGTYSQRSAGWLNKFPDDPLAVDLIPGGGVGAQLLGAVPIDDQGKLFNYAIYGVNGPSSADGTGNASALDLGGNVGLRSDNTVANLNGSPTGGGRVGFFAPFKPHYDFELGLSAQSGQWNDAGHHTYTAGVLDAAVHLGASIEAKGEYINTWYGSDDRGRVHPQGWFIQGGYKLAGLDLEFPLINNIELVGRYDSFHDGLGIKTTRESVGYVYYLSNTLLFEGDCEFFHSNDPTQVGHQFILQLSYGF